ncbi:MAG: glutamine amidotransferase [Robiginitomaculum sp.]|nr:MAG: glutamine amidotransferase [Robiginitomaculum sp.]
MPRLLIMEGNTLAQQARSRALRVRSASDVYIHAIRAHFPGLHLDVIHAADRGQDLPTGTSYADYDGLVISGSGLHAYDADFAVRNQIDLMRAFAQTGKPILGSCWGLQIAVIAAGGTVGLSPKGREVGAARNIALNDAGRAHPLFAGKPPCFDALCIHYDEILILPGDAILLSSNAHSPVQGAIIPLEQSEVWAVQYHPEYDLAQVAMMMRLYAKDMVDQGFFKDPVNGDEYIAKIEALHKSPDDFALAWQLGMSETILDDKLRRAEIINWITHQILK